MSPGKGRAGDRGIEDPHLSGENLVRGLAGVLFAEQTKTPRSSSRFDAKRPA